MNSQLETYLKTLSHQLFNELKTDEDLATSLHSEESQFYRFNQSKVRQNTSVNQHEVYLMLNKNKRTLHAKFNLTLNAGYDLKKGASLLQMMRTESLQIDENPQYVEMKNNGVSSSAYKSERPIDSEILGVITDQLKTDDCAGFWTSGPVRKASFNSKGQHHFFESDHFFFDYSFYNGPKAAKGFYSQKDWNENDFKNQVASTRQKLSLLNKPVQNVAKGKHRVFLEPMAVAEIVGTLAWGALSLSAHNQGRAPFKKLKDREQLLSQKFSLVENLDLGYVPAFNSIGELAQKQLPLIERGELKNMLVSTATSQEYKVQSNFAEPHEMIKSAEIRAGALDKANVLKELGTGLYLSNLHYINWSDIPTARMTGMTRFACFWVQNGEIVGPIQDLRFDETIYNLFGPNLVELTSHQENFTDTATYSRRSLGGMKVPGALIDSFNFTL